MQAATKHKTTVVIKTVLITNDRKHLLSGRYMEKYKHILEYMLGTTCYNIAFHRFAILKRASDTEK